MKSFAIIVAMLCVASGSRPAFAAATGPAPADFAPIETFLKANCIECHNAEKHKGDVSFEIFHDEASVLKGREVFEEALEKVRAGEMPPKKKPRPAKAASDEFLHRIEAIFYRHDLNSPEDPGRVTIRRLNRTEYNNTIRDLLGVDARPAEDFPSDDIGQGFDNIGDVLSMSPVLMERYLAAASAVMERAIPSDLPPVVVHSMNGRFFEPALRPGELPDTTNRGLKLHQAIDTPFTTTDEGQYTIQLNIYPDQPSDEGRPALVALTVDGKAIKTFDILKGTRRNAVNIEAKLDLPPGPHRFGITMLKSRNDDPEWILRVRFMEITGPPDTRPRSQRMLLMCDTKLPREQQTRQVLRRFASRAYRRPATDEEVARLAALTGQFEAGGRKWESAVQMAMRAVLISPKFLFRVELDDRPQTAGPHAIDEYQLASRLSYFLWSSMPDDELFDLAAKQQLSANLEAQVRRMLADPKSQALVDNFAMQWLQLRRLRNFAPDPLLFPTFDEKLRESMLTETGLFFRAVIREDRSILDLIDGDFTFLNEQLARHYNIGDTNGNPANGAPIGKPGQRIKSEEFVRVHLLPGPRGGVLTQASVLAVTSNPTRTSPVKRGKFVLEQILGAPPPPPPPNVPELPADAHAAASSSLRQRMEQHRANPACASCHEKMDGIGFAFENFDAVGAYRMKDGGFDIDPSGTMPDGSSFRGAGQLKTVLKEKKDLFSRCLTKKLLTYAIGRGVESCDNRAVSKIMSALKADDYKFSTLVVQIVKSDPFRMRPGKEQSP